MGICPSSAVHSRCDSLGMFSLCWLSLLLLGHAPSQLSCIPGMLPGTSSALSTLGFYCFCLRNSHSVGMSWMLGGLCRWVWGSQSSCRRAGVPSPSPGHRNFCSFQSAFRSSRFPCFCKRTAQGKLILIFIKKCFSFLYLHYIM